MGLFAAMILWGNSIYYGQLLSEYGRGVSIRYYEPSATINAIEKYIKSEEEEDNVEHPDVTLWNIVNQQNTENSNTGVHMSVNICEVYGNMKSIVPVPYLVGGAVLKADDVGCVIDKKTAFELWGTEFAIGNILVWNEKEWLVRGVLNTEESIVLVQENDETKKFSNIELQYADGKSEEQRISDFIMKSGLPNYNATVDGYFVGVIAKTIYLAIGWVIGLYVIIRMVKIAWRLRGVIVLFLIAICILTITILLLKWATQFKVELPERLIPTKWSDFSFWTNKWDNIKDNWVVFNDMKPLYKDLELKRYLYLCIVNGLGALIGFGICSGVIQKLGISNSNKFFLFEIGVVVITLIVLLLMTFWSRGFAVPRSYCLIGAIYLGFEVLVFQKVKRQ